MPHDVISTCPVCASELAVTRLHCRSCGTTLEGDFSVGRFGRLNRDQLTLLESFLRSRGNLREMERELGISYPTVRSRVEALVRALGFGPRADADDVDDPAGEGAVPPRSREEILQALARHEMSADEAAAAIRALGKDRIMTATGTGASLEHPLGAEGLLSIRLRNGDVRIRAVDSDRVTIREVDGHDLSGMFAVVLGEGNVSLRSTR